MQPLGDRLDDHLGGGEALGVGELLTVVDDVQVEPRIAAILREVIADVARADDVEVRIAVSSGSTCTSMRPPQISPFSCAKSSFSS